MGASWRGDIYLGLSVSTDGEEEEDGGDGFAWLGCIWENSYSVVRPDLSMGYEL